MEEKEVKEKLKKYPYLITQIESIIQEINGFRQDIQELSEYKSIPLTGMPNSTGHQDKIGNIVSKIVDVYENRIQSELLPLLKEKQLEYDSMNEILIELEHKEYFVVKARYMDKISWNKIAKKLFYSRSTVFRVHDKAIENIILMYEKR